jgi:F-type H+/Na+-transporting ATPase subunit alpha
MKKVAGTLRLDLASYRELEAFAQFGSDLDKATQAKLNRGARTVEVLKQDLHKPLTVEKQVAILYALTRGFLDDIPLTDIRRFESEYLNWLDHNRKDLLDHIVKTKDLPSDDDMAAALNAFKKTFAVSE